MADDLQDLCADLAAEHAALDAVVADLDDAAWDTPTASPRWAVRDQIGHLAYFDEAATEAITEPERFAADLASALSGDVAAFLASTEEGGRTLPPADLLAWWREQRAALLAAAAPLHPKTRVPWYGPSMGARSFVTARLMETWAHGQDVVDAIGASRPATDRLRHVADLGVRTRAFSYVVKDRPAPDGEVRVELVGPSGDTWSWGDPDAPDRVTGPAEDFCLVVTQRRHPDDTALVADGDLATEWLSI
ncbi:MAG TPA: TIGR03084 family metal-binding protein, partial [Acidimicrobiales bacterium]|nr:TIGR03084 family metal-binding protein [Acidimicrobiales bacterium]